MTKPKSVKRKPKPSVNSPDLLEAKLARRLLALKVGENATGERHPVLEKLRERHPHWFREKTRKVEEALEFARNFTGSRDAYTRHPTIRWLRRNGYKEQADAIRPLTRRLPTFEEALEILERCPKLKVLYNEENPAYKVLKSTELGRAKMREAYPEANWTWRHLTIEEAMVDAQKCSSFKELRELNHAAMTCLKKNHIDPYNTRHLNRGPTGPKFTHCKHGHEYTIDNTVTVKRKSGSRSGKTERTCGVCREEKKNLKRGLKEQQLQESLNRWGSTIEPLLEQGLSQRELAKQINRSRCFVKRLLRDLTRRKTNENET